MNIAEYHRRRADFVLSQKQFRTPCPRCLQAPRTCYCAHIHSFNPKIRFAILIHKLEMRRRIATGRMSHLVLENSRLIDGYDYSNDQRVNSILENQKFYPVLLYPGRDSLNLTTASPEEREATFPKDREPVIFVLDGTWSTAGKSLRRSSNIQKLPRICFTPTLPSRFRVRVQPRPNYCSTLEAIHHTLELIGPAAGFDTKTRDHDRLLHVFDKMVEQQLEFIAHSKAIHRPSRHGKCTT